MIIYRLGKSDLPFVVYIQKSMINMSYGDAHLEFASNIKKCQLEQDSTRTFQPRWVVNRLVVSEKKIFILFLY